MAVYSMTGYASVQGDASRPAAANPNEPGTTLGLELRSVNSRFLDLTLKLPEELRGTEPGLRELVAEYDDLVDRARRRRLTEDDVKGGIATVTNFGTFGLTTGTPIPLPNETLILGIGAGVKKPVWSEQVETFLPATEADLVLTFDHRVVDGGGAGVLLNRVAALLQEPEEL